MGAEHLTVHQNHAAAAVAQVASAFVPTDCTVLAESDNPSPKADNQSMFEISGRQPITVLKCLTDNQSLFACLTDIT